MIFVSVGTFVNGFNELISTMDTACATHGFSAFAQIGNSSILPRHMEYTRFLSSEEMILEIGKASLVVSHGGFGILGDAMRARKPIIAVPRQNAANSAGAPANDQLPVVKRLHEQYGIGMCVDMRDLPIMVNDVLRASISDVDYRLRCNINKLICNYLTAV